MDQIDTRQSLKVAAMRLFAERGVEAVSVRDIILESGARNGGALNYYFGGKDGLVSEIVEDIFRIQSKHWDDGLAKLLMSGGVKSVRDIIRILVYSPPTLLPGEQTSTSTRVMASLLFTRRKFVADQINKLNLVVYSRLLTYMRELRPDIPTDVMQQRLVYVSWYLAVTRSAREAAEAEGGGARRLWTSANSLGNLVDSATALIEAPLVDVLA